MFLNLLWMTLGLGIVFLAIAYFAYKDVFHPLIFFVPMSLLLYFYMPYKLAESGDLYTFVSEQQLEFVHPIVLATLAALYLGCVFGSRKPASVAPAPGWIAVPVLQRGAFIVGGIGLTCWLYIVQSSGGIASVFGQSYGAAWSDIGYIRDAVYLLIVAILLLMTPESFRHLGWKGKAAIVIFATPWVMQGLLGARRGPTFVITLAMAMSWYLARKRRPNLLLLGIGGVLLGGLMLFLVTNRGKIYLGSEELSEVSTDLSEVSAGANAHNEYIFGSGCIVAAHQTDRFFWGKRYAAQFIVRPIPRQIWPNKYEDFGVPELLQNAGVAGNGLEAVMGWGEIPGAAAGFVADLWVEFSWLAIPFAAFLGWLYGLFWRKATTEGGYWNIQFLIFMLLSVYLITQSMEAVIFRLVLLSVPAWLVWRQAAKKGLEMEQQLAPQPLHPGMFQPSQ
jgi:hypothetical protein